MANSNKVLLKDEVVKKIFTSGTEISQEYLLNIISAIIEIPIEKLKADFEIVTPHLGVNTNIINSEADLVYKNQDMYFSFEFNYNSYSELSKKNFSYLCQLYLRDIYHKEDYKNIKHIWQFCFDNFDYFKENRFVYFSEMMEKESHKIRDFGIHIVDINLDYLEKMDYNEVKKGSMLEKLLYIFVCNDKKKLDQVYDGDELMEEIRKEIQELTGDFDSLLYYDKKALEKRMGEWLGKKAMVKKMLDKKYPIKEINDIANLSEKEFSEMLEEIEKERED